MFVIASHPPPWRGNLKCYVLLPFFSFSSLPLFPPLPEEPFAKPRWLICSVLSMCRDKKGAVEKMGWGVKLGLGDQLKAAVGLSPSVASDSVHPASSPGMSFLFLSSPGGACTTATVVTAWAWGPVGLPGSRSGFTALIGAPPPGYCGLLFLWMDQHF